jgi:hypothetical protein
MNKNDKREERYAGCANEIKDPGDGPDDVRLPGHEAKNGREAKGVGKWVVGL